MITRRSLSPRERKLIALLLLMGVIALIHIVIIQPLLNGFADRAAQREALRVEQQHFDRTLASLPRLRRLHEANSEKLRLITLQAANPDKAGMLLEDRLRVVSEAAGAELRTSNHEGSDQSIIRARATVQMPLAALVTLVERLQNQPPYLVIDRITITADEAFSSQNAGPLNARIETSIPFVAAARK